MYLYLFYDTSIGAVNGLYYWIRSVCRSSKLEYWEDGWGLSSVYDIISKHELFVFKSILRRVRWFVINGYVIDVGSKSSKDADTGTAFVLHGPTVHLHNYRSHNKLVLLYHPKFKKSYQRGRWLGCKRLVVLSVFLDHFSVNTFINSPLDKF